ncbi:NAD-dependent epimerase/dehydratase family protein [Bradyrhizobium sp. dw_78]|uniref:NAD-dependent epimerase/dehydratase family protein n=1 Tax=Bradyrhizobium sp. dw_78 TaxID=2719793 RepID=UPI001BD4BE89|nr:NAD-dependent epimerase/dehydratase family protein [Bradyrhizobium sp. dw_78]
MTRALVTGGSGFIGQHLVSELVARGLQVRVLDVLLPTRALPAVDYVQGSVLDKGLVQEVMADVDEVYHLAGLPGMWKSDKADFHAVNFTGTENVLDAARQRGVARFMHCSTESILFRTSQTDGVAAEDAALTVEEMPGPYTRSKMLADRLALQAAATGFPVIVGCPTMPIGPHDHNLTPPTAMLQHFLGDGRFQMYLDFIVNLVDVRDVAVGLILAMEKGRVGQRYLLGGDCVPLSRILALMAAVNGRRKLFIPVPGLLAQLAASIIEFKADYVTRRTPAATVEGVRIARRASALSIEKAKRELGYAPRPVESVLRETIAHMMDVPLSRILKHA